MDKRLEYFKREFPNLKLTGDYPLSLEVTAPAAMDEYFPSWVSDALVGARVRGRELREEEIGVVPAHEMSGEPYSLKKDDTYVVSAASVSDYLKIKNPDAWKWMEDRGMFTDELGEPQELLFHNDSVILVD